MLLGSSGKGFVDMVEDIPDCLWWEVYVVRWFETGNLEKISVLLYATVNIEYRDFWEVLVKRFADEFGCQRTDHHSQT